MNVTAHVVGSTCIYYPKTASGGRRCVGDAAVSRRCRYTCIGGVYCICVCTILLAAHVLCNLPLNDGRQVHRTVSSISCAIFLAGLLVNYTVKWCVAEFALMAVFCLLCLRDSYQSGYPCILKQVAMVWPCKP